MKIRRYGNNSIVVRRLKISTMRNDANRAAFLWPLPRLWILATEKARFTRVDQLGLEHLVLYLLDDRSGDFSC